MAPLARLAWAGLLFAGAMTPQDRALGCSCSPIIFPFELFALSDAVFRGTPISVEQADPGTGELAFRYVFEVTACWKGVQDDSLILWSGINDANCGVELFVGEDYVICAGPFPYGAAERPNPSSGPGELWTTLCISFGAADEKGRQMLAWLGDTTCPTAVEGASWGRLKGDYR